MNELVLALAIWISGQTGYTIPNELPSVELVSQARLAELGKEYHYEIVGLYNDESNAVYLRQDFKPANIREQSDLLHELVHWLQAKNRTKLPMCDNSDEAEAYKLENRWLAEHGLPPATPELFIALASLCAVDNVDDAIVTLRENQVKR